jgi:hypothetical protein
MHSRALRVKNLGILTVRPLTNGDTKTVAAVLRRSGWKPEAPDLTDLASVDDSHHALVAYVDGDPVPAAIGQLVRDRRGGAEAEIAFVVADCYPRDAIASILRQLLAADTDAVGITRITEARFDKANRMSAASKTPRAALGTA